MIRIKEGVSSFFLFLFLSFPFFLPIIFLNWLQVVVVIAIIVLASWKIHPFFKIKKLFYFLFFHLSFHSFLPSFLQLDFLIFFVLVNVRPCGTKIIWCSRIWACLWSLVFIEWPSRDQCQLGRIQPMDSTSRCFTPWSCWSCQTAFGASWYQCQLEGLQWPNSPFVWLWERPGVCCSSAAKGSSCRNHTGW